MIRSLAAPDREPVRELLAATGNFNPAELAIADELIDAILDRPEQQDYHGFVFMSDDAPAGFAVFGPVPATTGTWHLYWIAVHPARQGTPVAAELAAFVEAFVRDRAGYLIVAETSSLPSYARARRFYEKQGYEQLVRVPDYYRPGDDLVLLAKRL